MHDQQSFLFVIVMFVLLLASLLLKRAKQPPVIAYIFTGALLGPSGFAVIDQKNALMQLGDVGIILLLFFIGMEMSLDKPLRFWLIPLVGTVLQVALSLALTGVLGLMLHWPFPKVLLLSFVVSLSSTAVILKLLEDWQELDSGIGQQILAILLVQDISVAPMLIAINHFSGISSSWFTVLLQLLGAIGAVTLIFYLFYKKSVRLPWLKQVATDHESQVFAALAICFGAATLFNFLHLSTAFGAFIAGLVVSATKETEWAHRSLSSLKVIFMALFFVSIGLLINRQYIWDHWFIIMLFLLLILVMNTVVNALILRAFRQPWLNAWYSGALLAQAGEFGYILLLLGLTNRIIEQSTYQLGISLITLSLIVSPFWANSVKRVLARYNTAITFTDIQTELEENNDVLEQKEIL